MPHFPLCTSVACRGEGANGLTAPGIQGIGHPKSEITEFKCCNKITFPIVRLLTHAAWIQSSKNASAPLVTESDKDNQFMLAAFFKSVALRTKMPFIKSEVIAFNCIVSKFNSLVNSV